MWHIGDYFYFFSITSVFYWVVSVLIYIFYLLNSYKVWWSFEVPYWTWWNYPRPLDCSGLALHGFRLVHLCNENIYRLRTRAFYLRNFFPSCCETKKKKKLKMCVICQASYIFVLIFNFYFFIRRYTLQQMMEKFETRKF